MTSSSVLFFFAKGENAAPRTVIELVGRPWETISMQFHKESDTTFLFFWKKEQSFVSLHFFLLILVSKILKQKRGTMQ